MKPVTDSEIAFLTYFSETSIFDIQLLTLMLIQNTVINPPLTAFFNPRTLSVR